MKVNRIEKIPVHIVSGFLGAGKTTFLNKFIKHNQPKRIFVIENEIGKVNIDGALVMEGTEEVLELTAGCLCCNLNGELYDLLFDLIDRSDEFDMLLIETTGIADPSAVAETFWSSTHLDKFFDLKSTIIVADALNLPYAVANNEEARRQIAFADVILLNKIDAVEPFLQAEVENIMKGLNPNVTVFKGTFGDFPHETICNLSAFSIDEQEKTNCLVKINHEYGHSSIKTFSLTFDRPFLFKELTWRLSTLMRFNQNQIYRIKGIIEIEDVTNRVILQTVFQSFRFTDGTDWEENEEKISKIVFIGNGVEKASIERIFNQCLVAKKAINHQKVKQYV